MSEALSQHPWIGRRIGYRAVPYLKAVDKSLAARIDTVFRRALARESDLAPGQTSQGTSNSDA